MADSTITVCPRCQAEGHFHRAEVEDNSGCAMLFFGGPLPYLLLQSSRSDMVVCPNCHYVFRAPVKLSRETLLGAGVLFILAALVVVVIYFFSR